MVIENKVKSIPNKKQLEEYTESFRDRSNVSFMLLSFSEPSFLDPHSPIITLRNGVSWRHLSYTELADRLQQVMPTVTNANEYHIEFISNRDRRRKCFEISQADEHGDFFGDRVDKGLLKEIRLHDMIDKLRYAQLAQEAAAYRQRDWLT